MCITLQKSISKVAWENIIEMVPKLNAQGLRYLCHIMAFKSMFWSCLAFQAKLGP